MTPESAAPMLLPTQTLLTLTGVARRDSRLRFCFSNTSPAEVRLQAKSE